MTFSLKNNNWSPVYPNPEHGLPILGTLETSLLLSPVLLESVKLGLATVCCNFYSLQYESINCLLSSC